MYLQFHYHARSPTYLYFKKVCLPQKIHNFFHKLLYLLYPGTSRITVYWFERISVKLQKTKADTSVDYRPLVSVCLSVRTPTTQQVTQGKKKFAQLHLKNL